MRSRAIERVSRAARTVAWLGDQLDSSERRLLLQAIIVGVVVWSFVAALKWSVLAGFDTMASLLARAPHAVFVLVPLVLGSIGVAAVARFHRTKVHYRAGDGSIHALDTVEGDGLERAIALYFTSEPTLDRALLGERGLEARWRLPTFSLALRKMLASWLTLSSGAAGGLEASVTLVGESVAAGLFKPRVVPRVLPARLSESIPIALRADWSRSLRERLVGWWSASQPEDLQAAQLCGIAAAVSTLLGTPFAAAFFAIEVIYRRRPIVDRLIYALVSALIAFFLDHLVHKGHTPFIRVSARPPLYDLHYYGALAAVAVSMALLAIAFRALRATAERFFHTRCVRPLVRHISGAAITGLVGVAIVTVLPRTAITLPAGTTIEGAIWLVLGIGDNVINAALAGKLGLGIALVALVGRFFATISTISSGGSAGLLFPTLIFGCLVASAWADVLGVPPALLVVPAMTASLASVANVPLAAMMIVIEAFGSHFIVPSMFVLVLASLFAHENSIYRAQRDSFETGQILPGMSVRRIRVPSGWAGQSLSALGIRTRFGLTVIGMVDRREGADGELEERIVLNPPADQALTHGDLLIVLGEDERIEAFLSATVEQTLS